MVVVFSPGTGVLFTRPRRAAAHQRNRLPVAQMCRRSLPAPDGVDDAGAIGGARNRGAELRAFDAAGNRACGPDQHPESQAHDLLFGIPAAVRAGGCHRRPARDAGAERSVQAADPRGARRLRPVRRYHPRPRHLAANGGGLDAPDLCCRLRGARRQARDRRASAAVRLPRPSGGWPRDACRPVPRRRRSSDGSSLSAWRSTEPACRRARCWARRC